MILELIPHEGKRKRGGKVQTVQHPQDKVRVNGKLVGYCGHQEGCKVLFIRQLDDATAKEVVQEVAKQRSEAGKPEPTNFVQTPGPAPETIIEETDDE